MRIAIVTTRIPFITGGAEILAQSLSEELRKRGHEADIVSIPFKWYPPERVLDCMLMGRLVDVTEVDGRPIDRMIGLKFPAYYCDHPNKVCWILHQHRQAYDLFETPYGDLHQSEKGRRVADEIRRWDNALLPEARGIYTIARTVSQRLSRYNGIASTPLYHPPQGHEKFHCDGFGDFVLYPGRFDSIKRQHLLVEALAMTKTPVKIAFIGSMQSSYAQSVLDAVRAHGLSDRVECMGFVDEATKLSLYATCLAVYNGVYDEDYGYLTLEAFCASKPVITHVDSGGPMEFVTPEENGIVTDPDPRQLALALDRLFEDRTLAENMGKAGAATLRSMNVDWEFTLSRLLQ
jgi:glycosyltransferase involved in cell wall biosynthesis